MASVEADLVVFPEATLSRFGRHIGEVAEPLDGPFVNGLRQIARENGTALIAGVWEPDGGRVANTTLAIDTGGSIKGTYRKIHLFDSFGSRESEFVSPGSEPVVAELDGLRVGLATCYDVRFPELFRKLVDQGADVFAVIAAWASGPLKEDHWTTMVRARAIENTTWTVAVGQPPHSDGFGVGHSMLVDPMGVVTRDLGPAPAVETAYIDPGRSDAVRAALPSLTHRRFTIGDIAG